MVALQEGCVQPNHHLIFSRSTLLIMDVTISHVYNVHHSYKSGNCYRWKGPSNRITLNIINSLSNVVRSPYWWKIL